MSQPIGSLCVLASDDHRDWTVGVCQGQGRRLVLRRFDQQEQASEWALEERARRLMSCSTESPTVHFPDDCPCDGNNMTW
jgi:hypothetical protein